MQGLPEGVFALGVVYVTGEGEPRDLDNVSLFSIQWPVFLFRVIVTLLPERAPADKGLAEVFVGDGLLDE